MTTLIISDRAGMDVPQVSRLGRNLLTWMVSVLMVGIAQAAGEELAQGVDGDLGVGGYYTGSIVRGRHDELRVLPYADFNYRRMFARVDTLGIKTLKLGYGHLEVVTRVSQDGFSTNVPGLQGLRTRETSIPVGIGSLQVTPLGGLMVNAFHDVRQSRGNWLEAIYIGELEMRPVTFYPMLGAEYQSGEYVRYFYGISPQEAANSQYATYQPAGSFNGLFGLIADIDLADGYHLNCYARRKWLGDAIQQSPIVGQSYLDTGYLALSYRFK